MHVLWMLGEAEPSKTPFFIVGGALALWAVVLAAYGITRPEFPANAVAARGVMAISFVLMVGAMIAAVATG